MIIKFLFGILDTRILKINLHNINLLSKLWLGHLIIEVCFAQVEDVQIRQFNFTIHCQWKTRILFIQGHKCVISSTQKLQMKLQLAKGPKTKILLYGLWNKKFKNFSFCKVITREFCKWPYHLMVNKLLVGHQMEIWSFGRSFQKFSKISIIKVIY